MKKWFRWWGLAAFAGVMLVIFVCWYFVVDVLIERSIERYGTRAVGAKVELGAADLSLFPLRLELVHLQVANPEAPMTNAVEFDRAEMAIDTAMLIRRKVIIDAMTLQGLRFDTPRVTSGALALQKVAAEKKTETTGGGLQSAGRLFSGIELPDIQDILQRENLKSLEMARSLESDIQKEKQQWEERLQQLPDKAKFEAYRQRLKKLKSSTKGGISALLGASTDAAQLKTDIEKDLQNLDQAAQNYRSDLKGYENRIATLAKAPMEDVKRLQKKYSLSTGGLANLSGLLMGNQVRGWVSTAAAWYNRLEPSLSRAAAGRNKPETVRPVRGEGLNVRFRETSPAPDFLIRLVDATVIVKETNLTGEVRNITPDQAVLGQPLTFNFAGKNLKDIGSIQLDGIFDRINPAKQTSTFNAALRDYPMKNVVLSDNPTLPLTANSGNGFLRVNARLENDQLQSDLKGRIESLHMTSPGGSASAGPYAEALQNALASIRKLNVTADIRGSLDNPQVTLSSDIDNVLSDAVGGAVRGQVQKFQNELETAILQKVRTPVADTDARLADFKSVGSELDQRLKLGKELSDAKSLPF